MLNETISNPVTRAEAREQAIALLDAASSAAREAREHAALTRVNLDRYIALCRLHGLRLHEIAEITGLSIAGVQLAATRARQAEQQQSGVA